MQAVSARVSSLTNDTEFWRLLYQRFNIGDVVTSWSGGGDSGQFEHDAKLGDLEEVFDIVLDDVVKELGNDWPGFDGCHDFSGTATLSARGLELQGDDETEEQIADTKVQLTLPEELADVVVRVEIAFARSYSCATAVSDLVWVSAPPSPARIEDDWDDEAAMALAHFTLRDGPVPDLTAAADAIFNALASAVEQLVESVSPDEDLRYACGELIWEVDESRTAQLDLGLVANASTPMHALLKRDSNELIASVMEEEEV